MEEILLVEFEIDPGATIGNDPRVVEDLSSRVGFDLILIKKDPRGAMKLADDHPFRTVDDEGPVFCHQRDFTKIDLLLFDRLDAS